MPDPADSNDSSETKAPKRPSGIIMSLAQVAKWEIGPTKESDCGLTFTLTIKNWLDAETIRRLAGQQVVVRVAPLQLALKEGEGCNHPENMRMAFDDMHAVCLECGVVLDVPLDDQQGKSEA